MCCVAWKTTQVKLFMSNHCNKKWNHFLDSTPKDFFSSLPTLMADLLWVTAIYILPMIQTEDTFLCNDTPNASSAPSALKYTVKTHCFGLLWQMTTALPLQLLKFWFVSHVYCHIATGLNTILVVQLNRCACFSVLFWCRVSTSRSFPFYLRLSETQR